jgi:hypothetical protein
LNFGALPLDTFKSRTTISFHLHFFVKNVENNNEHEHEHEIHLKAKNMPLSKSSFHLYLMEKGVSLSANYLRTKSAQYWNYR